MNNNTILSLALLSALTAGAFAQGSLTPPPGAPAPAMKTLQQIWDGLAGQSTQITALQQEHQTQAALLTALYNQTTALQAQNTALQTQNQSLVTMLNSMSEAAGTLPWTGSIIEASVGEGTGGHERISMALAPDGQPAVAYAKKVGTQDTLRYAKYNGSTWIATTVDSSFDVGYYASLAFSPAGQPAISYYDATNKDLRFASFNGTAWTISALDAAAASGRFNSLAFNSLGQPCISYEVYDNTDKLRYAVFNGTSWTFTDVLGGLDSGRHTSLKFHPNTGLPSIASYNNFTTDLTYSSFQGGSWAHTNLTLDASGTSGLSLQFTPDARPAVAYYKNGGDWDIGYAEWQNGRWNHVQIFTAEDAGRWPSLAFAPGGQPYVSYTSFDSSTSRYRLHLATRQGQKWISTPIAEEITQYSGFSSLIIMPNGQPAVAFKDSSNTWRFRVRQPL
jgi:hypothetical protein